MKHKKIPCHAEVCPVCKGEGEIEFGHVTDYALMTAAFPVVVECGACGGDGWILVPNYIEVEEDEG